MPWRSAKYPSNARAFFGAMTTGLPSFAIAMGPNRRMHIPAAPSADRNCLFCAVLTFTTTFRSRPPLILLPYPRGDKVMYDVNPLGPLMHLKELDRQAVSMLRPPRFGSRGDFRVAAFSASMISFLRRLLAAGRDRIGASNGLTVSWKRRL